MAAGRPRDNHEELRVKIEQAKREELPAVELEKKEIKMVVTLPQMTVPSIVMTTFDDGSRATSASTSPDADRIVGITASPVAERLAPVTSGRQPEQTSPVPQETKTQGTTPFSPKLGTSRLTAEESTSILEKTENLMEFFQDHEKQKDLAKRQSTKRPRKPRSPSPSPVRQSIGLDHLDNLVRLMEQLSNLRDENVRLKSRCDYLESTKTLLQAKSSLDDDVLLVIQQHSLPRMKKGKSQSTKSSKSDGGAVSLSRPRLSSVDDATGLEFGESSSDQTPKRPGIGKMMKRSFSTGSLEVPSDIMEQSGEDEIGGRTLLEDPFELKHVSKLSKSPEIKRKSKFSKWGRVKKILTKQQLSENISSGISSGLRSIKGFGKGAYLRYGSLSGRELAVPSVAESRSVDSGVGSGMDGELQDVRKSTSSGEPPSPTRFVERHIDVPTPQVDECMGIWLGPPEWIEKEREREQQLLKESKESKGLSESPKSDPGDVGSPLSVSGFEEESDKFLQVPIPRRQSSPLLLDEFEEEYEESHLKRSSSCKDPDGSKAELDEPFHKSEKKHKTPWGKMKHIIHTGRKDSIKKKHRKHGRELDSFGFEEVSETDLEVYDDMKYVHEGYLEGPVSRSTPKTSPVVFRQKQQDKSLSASPPSKGAEASGKMTTVSGGTIDVSALLGGVSDEFTRKLQEWEELKGKRTSGQYKEPSEYSESASYESAGAVSPEFLKKLEESENAKAIKRESQMEKKALESQQEQEVDSSSDETEGVSTPPEQPRQSVNLEEMQKKITDSFSRKMEEWERQKYRRHHSQTADGQEAPQKFSFRDRQKSKKTKEEKEREKLEKMREREILRVEREQQKLEKERMRIEKERLKALEREAKIEKMKGRLSQPDMESQLKNPILSPLQEYKVTSDFARKLHEWEMRKGKDSGSTAMYLEAHKRSLQFATEYQNAANILNKTGETTGQETTDTDEPQMRKTSSESDDMFLMEEPEKKAKAPKVKGQRPPPLTLVPCFDSPEVSPAAPLSDDSSLDDQSTETMESMTQANITSLEKANAMLLEQLRQKEIEYFNLQEDVRDLNEQVVTFRDEHAMELDQYKRQLLEGFPSGEIALDTKNMSTTLSHLENKIMELQKFGEQLAMSMEGAAIGKFQTVEGEESINNRLIDLLDKMRLLLQQASYSAENTLEEVSKKSSALRNFEKLYSQAIHLQVQMNNLRLSQLERNKEIMNMKRHLLIQEANNLLLQADVTRREAELLHYREYAQRRVPIKRWNTYSGKEDRPRVGIMDYSPKETVFQRVQRLRSARIISSTTDSDSDVPSKSPPMQHRESPRVRKRESPKARRKDSPKTRKKESPSVKKRESPLTRRKESPRLGRLQLHEAPIYERETERREEHVRQSSIKIHAEGRREPERSIHFSTVALPTARLTLPKDISPHEMNGVPRSSRSAFQSKFKADSTADKTSEPSQTSKGAELKFPELLIPEWKKQSDKSRKSPLQRMPSIERDEVFESDENEVPIEKSATKVTEKEYVTRFNKRKLEEGMKLIGDISFDSSETSEDTLKYLSPEASPAPRFEPPRFPSEIKFGKVAPDSETASDPGASRPTSLIRVAVSSTTPTLIRKPPFGRGQSTRLNIPVIPLRRIKPAQELLEESQRYRSGHSIYLTRILKRYPMKIECRSRSLEDKRNADKENIKEGYVKSIVEKMSREGTPDSKSSPKLAPKGSNQIVSGKDSPKSEFVHHIVRKLSTPNGSPGDRGTVPLKDLTNDGQVRAIKQAFTNGSSDSENRYVSVVIKGQGSQDFTSYGSSSSASTLTFSQLSTRTEPDRGGASGSPIQSRLTYSSMPMLSLEGDDSMRERSATTSRTSGNTTPTQGYPYSPKGSPSQRHKIHVAVSLSPGKTRRVIDPNMSPARLRRLMDPASPGRRRRFKETTPIEQLVEEPMESSTAVAQSQPSPSVIESSSITIHSPKSKKDKTKKGTIGALCRQSMTFDLGVSIQASEGEQGAGAESQAAVRHSTSSTASTSSQSEEIEGATAATPKERKKSRHKFLESSFIQKSRKFFKVSKENRCPSLECCGSDREVKKV